jgi:HEPN domain-containing protein/predicted nucleotidyltransferase
MSRKAKKPAVEFQGYRYHSPDIPMSAIRRCARRIVERFRPDKIILFGSYAYGQPHEWSDVDLLVVMPARNQIDQSIRIINALEPPFSLDLIVRTPKRLNATGRMGTGSFARSWRREGRSMRRQTSKWVRKAEDDIIGSRKLVQNKPPLHDLVCFHCQQSAEKYLKGVLQEWGLVPPRTHNLVDLLILLLLPRDPSLQSLRRRVDPLTRYSVDFRYPDERATNRQARAALRHAEAVRKEIRTRLGLQPCWQRRRRMSREAPPPMGSGWRHRQNRVKKRA